MSAARRERVEAGPAAVAYGAELRRIFNKQSQSQNHVAQLIPVDPSQLSRYLSGKLIAGQQHVEALVREVRRLGGEVTDGDVARLHELRRAAQSASASQQDRVLVLQEQMDEVKAQLGTFRGQVAGLEAVNGRLERQLDHLAQRLRQEEERADSEYRKRLQEQTRRVEAEDRTEEGARLLAEAERQRQDAERRARQAEGKAEAVSADLRRAKEQLGAAAQYTKESDALLERQRQQLKQLRQEVVVLRRQMHRLTEEAPASATEPIADDAMQVSAMEDAAEAASAQRSPQSGQRDRQTSFFLAEEEAWDEEIRRSVEVRRAEDAAWAEELRRSEKAARAEEAIRAAEVQRAEQEAWAEKPAQEARLRAAAAGEVERRAKHEAWPLSLPEDAILRPPEPLTTKLGRSPEGGGQPTGLSQSGASAGAGLSPPTPTPEELLRDLGREVRQDTTSKAQQSGPMARSGEGSTSPLTRPGGGNTAARGKMTAFTTPSARGTVPGNSTRLSLDQLTGMSAPGSIRTGGVRRTWSRYLWDTLLCFFGVQIVSFIAFTVLFLLRTGGYNKISLSLYLISALSAAFVVQFTCYHRALAELKTPLLVVMQITLLLALSGCQWTTVPAALNAAHHLGNFLAKP